MFQNIPQAMSERPQWVLWALEPRTNAAGVTRQTKVPYTIRGEYAKANTPATWGSYAAAIQALAGGGYNGVGYMFSQDDPFTGVDLDHSIVDGRMELWASAIASQLQSYTEISQSGSGAHIIVQASLHALRTSGVLKTGKRRDNLPNTNGGGLEIYDRDRFFAMTGNMITVYPSTVEPRQDETIEIVTIYLLSESVKKPATHTSTPRPETSRDDSNEAVIARISRSKQGTKFDALMRGDTSGHDDNQSQADESLLCIIAGYTKDVAQIESIFDCSQLANRDKWGRDDYRSMSIQKALDFVTFNANEQQARTESLLERVKTGAKTGDGVRAVYESLDTLASLDVATLAPLKAQFKAALGSQLNLNDFDKAVNQARRDVHKNDSPPTNGLAEIIITNRPLRDISQDAQRAIMEANSPPVFFRRSSALARLVTSDDGHPVISAVGSAEMRGRLTRVANIFRLKDDEKMHTDASDNLIHDLLQLDTLRAPVLAGVTEIPVMRPDGSVLDMPGYDPMTKLYYSPDAAITIGKVPDQPTPRQLAESLALVEEIIADFPFENQASHAAALGLMLTPIVRPAIDGMIPLALIDAPVQGTGKSLLAEAMTMLASGRATATMTAPTTEEEWAKKLASIISTGAGVITIDNIEGTFRSAVLCAALTAPVLTDRILGQSAMGEWPQRATWIATGNNIRLAGDLPRRCYHIRLDARTSKPWLSKQEYKHPKLIKWITEKRGDLVTALLTIARAWYAAGCPRSHGMEIGGYESWSQTIGDILAFAGVSGFLENLDNMYEESDDDAPQWEAFLLTLQTYYRGLPFSVASIVSSIASEYQHLRETLPDDLASDLQRGNLARKLGQAFRKRIKTRYGVQGVRIEREGGQEHHAVLWCVRCDDQHEKTDGAKNNANLFSYSPETPQQEKPVAAYVSYSQSTALGELGELAPPYKQENRPPPLSNSEVQGIKGGVALDVIAGTDSPNSPYSPNMAASTSPVSKKTSTHNMTHGTCAMPLCEHHGTLHIDSYYYCSKHAPREA